MKQKDSSHARSLKLAGIFSLFLGIIICIAIILKIVSLFVYSSFDGKHQYILFDIQKNGFAQVIVFNPAVQTITITHITNASSEADIEKNLLLSYDGLIHDPITPKNENTINLLGRLLLHFIVFQPKNINQADVYKLWVYAKGVSNASLQEKTITFPLQAIRSDLLNDFYIDHTLFQEAATITIVNATGRSGVGSILAGVVTTIGGNVIAVNTADGESDMSVIYGKNKSSYTLKRLSELLHIPVVIKSQPLSDIIVIIGKDKSKLPYFSL